MILDTALSNFEILRYTVWYLLIHKPNYFLCYAVHCLTTTPICNFIVFNITHCFKFQILCLGFATIPKYLLVQACFMFRGSWYILHPHLNDKTFKDVLNTLLSRFSFHCCIIQRNTGYCHILDWCMIIYNCFNIAANWWLKSSKIVSVD